MKEHQSNLAVTLLFICFRGSAPSPAGGTYDAPPDPLVDWGRRPFLIPSHSAPLAPRLPRGAFGAYVISYENSAPPPTFFIQESLLALSVIVILLLRLRA